MQDYLTTAGLAAVISGQYSRIVTFKLGSLANYTPNVTDSDIRGAVVHSGTITEVGVLTPSLVRITVVLGSTLGPFTYGEAAIFLDDGSLFSLSSWPELVTKLVQTADPDGNQYRIDLYVDVTGGTAAINTGTSKNKVAIVSSHTALPNPVEASNFYVFPHPTDSVSSCTAYSTGLLWSFSDFSRASTISADLGVSALGFTTNGVSTNANVGQLVQVGNGQNKGQVRRIDSIVVGSSSTAFTFDVPLLITLSVNDSIILYKSNSSQGNVVVSPSVYSFDAGNNRIVNLSTPNIASDAANRGYVDTNFIGSSNQHPPLQNISWNGKRLTNLAEPVLPSDAATRGYVDSISVGGGFSTGAIQATGNVNLGNNKLTNVATPTASGDATTKIYVDNLTGGKLSKAGDSMTGTLNMGANLITNIAAAINPGDAVSKSFADTYYLRTSGVNAMSGPLSMGNNLINNVATPILGADVANKDYVDSSIQLKAAKDPVLVASTGQVNLSAPGSSMDGVSLTPNARFLVKDQVIQSENGIYIWNSAGTPATRSTDFNTSAKAQPGSTVRVLQGTANSGTSWVLQVAGSIVLGGSDLSFSQVTMGSASGAVLTNGASVMTGALNMGTNRITNIASPVNPTDAVPRAYFEAQVNPVAVEVASVGNINLSAPGLSLDGIALTPGMRFLAKDQTVQSQNGVYLFNTFSTAATRASDFNSIPAIHYGAVVYVQQGTINAATQWKLVTTGTITVGSSNLIFTNPNPASGILPDGSVSMTGNFNAGGNRVVNVGAPTLDSDGATKKYVDDIVYGKQNIEVRLATTVNINLNAPGSSIDGVALSLNNLFLVKNQTSAGQNGVYQWNGSAVPATRAGFYSVASQISGASLIVVQEGTLYQNSVWILTTNAPISLGATALTYGRIDGSGGFSPDGSVPMTGSLNSNTNRIINVGQPTTATDATTFQASEFASRGFLLRTQVSVVSSTNVTIASPGSAIDGVSITSGSRVLLRNQTLGAENGLWVWNGSSVFMTRPVDADTSSKVTRGLLVYVTSGSSASQYWCNLTMQANFSLGSTAQFWAQLDPDKWDLKNLPRVLLDTNVSGAYVLNMGLYEEFQLTLTGNVSFSVSGGVPSTRFVLKLRQDVVGNRTVTLPTTVRFNSSVPSYSHTGTPNSLDLLGFRYDFIDGKLDLMAMIKNLQ